MPLTSRTSASQQNRTAPKKMDDLLLRQRDGLSGNADSVLRQHMSEIHGRAGRTQGLHGEKVAKLPCFRIVATQLEPSRVQGILHPRITAHSHQCDARNTATSAHARTANPSTFGLVPAMGQWRINDPFTRRTFFWDGEWTRRCARSFFRMANSAEGVAGAATLLCFAPRYLMTTSRPSTIVQAGDKLQRCAREVDCIVVDINKPPHHMTSVHDAIIIPIVRGERNDDNL